MIVWSAATLGRPDPTRIRAFCWEEYVGFCSKTTSRRSNPCRCESSNSRGLRTGAHFPVNTSGKDLCDLGLPHAVLGMPMAAFWSWLLREDGGVEGRVADTVRELAWAWRSACVQESRIAEKGWLQHWASPIGVLCAVARVLQTDVVRV